MRGIPSQNLTIPSQLLLGLSQRIHEHTGLLFPQSRWSSLSRGLVAAAEDLGHDCVTRFAQNLLSPQTSNHDLDVLVSHLTVGETYFMRDHAAFSALKNQIIPALLAPSARQARGERPLRIWSAGCSSGEEPFSIAILIDGMRHELGPQKVEIIGTDITARSLDKAKRGVYTQWSFRGLSHTILETYFQKLERNSRQLSHVIVNQVTFCPLNLASSDALKNVPWAPADIILCRNVMMYFSAEVRKRVTHQLTDLLAEGGWFLVSPSETAFVTEPTLTRTHFGGTTVFQKQSPGFGDRAEGNIHTRNHVFTRQTLASRSQRSPARIRASASMGKNSWATAAPSTRPYRPPQKPDGQPRVWTGHVKPREDSDGLTFKRTSQDSSRLISSANGSQGAAGIDPEQAHEKALSLFQTGNHEAVALILSAALTGEHPFCATQKGISSMLLLARAFANLGKLEAAQRWCRRTLAADKLLPDAHFLLASILQELGHFDEASQSLRQTLFLAPDMSMAQLAMANLLSRRGMPREAMTYLRAGYRLLDELDPGAPVAHSDGLTAQKMKEVVRVLVDRTLHTRERTCY